MNDPKRLRDFGDDLGTLVRAAEADVMDDEAIARLHTRLAAVGVASATIAIAKPSVFRLLAFKVLGVVGAGAIAAIAIAAWPTHRTTVTTAPTAIATSTPTPTSQPVEMVAAPTNVPSIPVMDLPRAKPQARVAVAEAHTTTEPPPAPAATSPREGLLLLRARRALPTDPALALSLVQQHETEFPASQLAPERDQIRREARTKEAR